MKEWKFLEDSESLDLFKLSRQLCHFDEPGQQKYLKDLKLHAPIVFQRFMEHQKQYKICPECFGRGGKGKIHWEYPESHPLHTGYEDCRLCGQKGAIYKTVFQQIKNNYKPKFETKKCSSCGGVLVGGGNVFEIDKDYIILEIAIKIPSYPKYSDFYRSTLLFHFECYEENTKSLKPLEKIDLRKALGGK